MIVGLILLLGFTRAITEIGGKNVTIESIYYLKVKT